MDLVRLVLYAIGVIISVAVAFWYLGVPSRLAKYLSFTYAALAIISASFWVSLLIQMILGSSRPWNQILFTLAAFLLAAAPAAMGYWLVRDGRK